MLTHILYLSSEVIFHVVYENSTYKNEENFSTICLENFIHFRFYVLVKFVDSYHSFVYFDLFI